MKIFLLATKIFDGLWWLDGGVGDKWSKEEVEIRLRALVVMFSLWLIISIPCYYIFQKIGYNSHVSAVVFIPVIVLAMLAARPICLWFWPKAVRAAEENQKGRRSKQSS